MRLAILLWMMVSGFTTATGNILPAEGRLEWAKGWAEYYFHRAMLQEWAPRNRLTRTLRFMSPRGAKIRIGVDSYFDPDSWCDDETLAYIDGIGEARPRIWICPVALEGSPEELGQTVIHELIHARGVLDECETSREEFEIMMRAGAHPFDSGYVEECGITLPPPFRFRKTTVPERMRVGAF